MKSILWICCIAALLATAVGDATARAWLRMAITTSPENSGLIEVLLPPFEKANNVRVEAVAVGTGKAISLGQNGDVDLLFVHARELEEKFVTEGYGVYRRNVMYNDFIIIGPKNDPAKVKEAKSAAEAFKRIAEAKVAFISRGDGSGTHEKEKSIWKAAGIKPEGKWYMATGMEMSHVIEMTFEKNGYTLADRGTYLAYKQKTDMPILFEGDKMLFNPYVVIAVNPKKYPHVQHELAKKFIDYLTGPEGQKIIGDFKVDGKQLFLPNAAIDGKYSAH